MSDKPGCTTMAQLDMIKATVAETGRIWSIDFSERFEVPAVTRAAELVARAPLAAWCRRWASGRTGSTVTRGRDWFFDREAYGGILTDIASHQIDQFLFFTGSADAEVTMASVANYANPDDPGLQDFGEIGLRSPQGHGYIRVDWYTPDALPTWGDGRLTILGTEGYIELRKYVDVGPRGHRSPDPRQRGRGASASTPRAPGCRISRGSSTTSATGPTPRCRRPMSSRSASCPCTRRPWPKGAGHDPRRHHRGRHRGRASGGLPRPAGPVPVAVMCDLIRRAPRQRPGATPTSRFPAIWRRCWPTPRSTSSTSACRRTCISRSRFRRWKRAST